MKICNTCKKALPDDSEFCQYCRSTDIYDDSISNKKVLKRCIDCGKELPDDSEFCQYCGSKRIATINNEPKVEKKTKDLDLKNNHGKQSGVLWVLLACAVIFSIFMCGLYSETKNKLDTYISKNESLQKELSTKESQLYTYKTKSGKYDDVLEYASYSRGYSDFYARQTVVRKPNNTKIWIYMNHYATIYSQVSSSAVNTEWGDFSGSWVPLYVSYTGTGVEYIKIYNSYNSEYFYIIVVG